VPSQDPSSPTEEVALAEEGHPIREGKRGLDSVPPKGPPEQTGVQTPPTNPKGQEPERVSSSSSDRPSARVHPPAKSIECQTTNTIQSVYELEKGAFAAPGIKMDSKHFHLWKEVIKPRLEDTLRHRFRPLRGLDPSLALEFMMAGPSDTDLKPTIVIVCCNEAHRKQLRKIFKVQKWISDYNYRCMVVVDSFRKYASGSKLGEGRSVRVRLSEESSTLCGVLSELEQLVSLEPISFTLGGVILIEGKPYGLTVGHVYESISNEFRSDLENTDEEDGGLAEDEDQYDSPFVIIEDTEGSLTETDNIQY
jgi:hypothetical protein